MSQSRLRRFPPEENGRPDDGRLSTRPDRLRTVRPDPEWPGGARIALQFVINFEEGAENSILHGDEGSESLLTEFGFVTPRIGRRYLPVESRYEYATRVGFWRLHDFCVAPRIHHRFTTSPGFDWGAPFFENLRNGFDVLYEQGERSPRMMAAGLHCRLVGRPGRFAALRLFVDHVQSHDRVWLARGVDIAEHWRARFPAPCRRSAQADQPSSARTCAAASSSAATSSSVHSLGPGA